MRYEGRLIGDNNLSMSYRRIMRAAEYALTWEEQETLLFELETAVNA